MFPPGTEFCKLVGRNVRRERRALGITQEDLAQKTGLNRTHLSDIERGQGNPSVSWLQDVAAALAIHPALLFLEVTEADVLRRSMRGHRPSKPAGPVRDPTA